MVGLVCKRIVQLTNVPVPCNYSWPVIAPPEFSIHYSYTEDIFFRCSEQRGKGKPMAKATWEFPQQGVGDVVRNTGWAGETGIRAERACEEPPATWGPT